MNLMTFLRALKESTSTLRGVWGIRKVRPSAQGGVVKLPVYWKRGVLDTCSTKASKGRPSTLVLVPGVWIASTLGARAVRRSKASAGSEVMSKSRSTTAMAEGSAKKVG